MSNRDDFGQSEHTAYSTSPGERAGINGIVVTGDNNVVLNVGGFGVTAVASPKTQRDISRLLFGAQQGGRLTRPSRWLLPEAGLLPYVARPEAEDILAWIESETSTIARLMVGPAGQGKTRAASYVCEQLRSRGWLAGFVTLPLVNWHSITLADIEQSGPGRPGIEMSLRRVTEIRAAFEAIFRHKRRVFLVIDYAETSGSFISELISQILDADALNLVRILLLSRQAGVWFSELIDEYPGIVSPHPLELLPLPSQLGDAASMREWRRAVQVFSVQATKSGIVSEKAPRTKPRVQWKTALEMYADALVSILESRAPAEIGDTASVNPIYRLLQQERKQVSLVLSGADIHITDTQRDWAISSLCLRPASTLDAAEQALRLVPDHFRISDSKLRKAAAALVELYSNSDGEGWEPVRPEILAEIHLLDTAGNSDERSWREGVIGLCSAPDVATAYQSASILFRALAAPQRIQKHGHAKNTIASTLGQLLERFPNQYLAPFTAFAPSSFDERLADLISGADARLNAQTLDEVARLLLRMGSTDRQASLALGVLRRLATARQELALDGEQGERAYAQALNNLGVRLGEAGQREEALAPLEEALSIYRRLADANPGAYMGDLAATLNNLGVRLGELGRREEALAPLEESLAIYRRLADANPAAYLPDLASGLGNLGVSFAALGRTEQALFLAEESSALARQLVASNPVAYLPTLGGALNNLSVRLGEVGRREEALDSSHEALSIYQRLADANPGAYMGDLAATLNNLGVRLGELGRREEALAPLEESLAIYRRLADANPAAYLPDLASGLGNLGVSFAALGRTEQALFLAEESSALARQLVASNPVAYLPTLGGALNNLSVRLGEVGRREEALDSSHEALSIYQRLADANPGAYMGDLAVASSNLLVRLAELGDWDQALDSSQRALRIFRRLAEENAAANLPSLAGALYNDALVRMELGQFAAAQAAAEESLEIYKELRDSKSPGLLRALISVRRLIAWSARSQGSLGVSVSALTEAVNSILEVEPPRPAWVNAAHRATLSELAEVYELAGDHSSANEVRGYLNIDKD